MSNVTKFQVYYAHPFQSHMEAIRNGQCMGGGPFRTREEAESYRSQRALKEWNRNVAVFVQEVVKARDTHPAIMGCKPGTVITLDGNIREYVGIGWIVTAAYEPGDLSRYPVVIDSEASHV